jgi:hypothetical protein
MTDSNDDDPNAVCRDVAAWGAARKRHRPNPSAEMLTRRLFRKMQKRARKTFAKQ